MAGCPECKCTLRGSFKAGLWVCLGGTAVAVPGGWYSGGPGLVDPSGGPGVIYHARTRWIPCTHKYRVPDHELTDPERKWQEHLFKEEEEKTTPSALRQADYQPSTNTGERCRVTYEVDGHRVR
jgi:hypothetical protein